MSPDEIAATGKLTVTSPSTCLRYEREKRYCWPSDYPDLCEVCQQLLQGYADEFGRIIEKQIHDRIRRALNEGREER